MTVTWRFTTGLDDDTTHPTFGGYGQSASGRHQYGAPASVIEPRYNESVPLDEEVNVSTRQWLIFTTYFYSSTPNFPDGVEVEISEDNGLSFVSAELLPYEIIKRRLDSQNLWFKIRKLSGEWPPATFIVVRYTGSDEYANVATKTIPVKWG